MESLFTFKSCQIRNHEKHTQSSVNFLEYFVCEEMCKIGPSAPSLNIQIFPCTQCLIYYIPSLFTPFPDTNLTLYSIACKTYKQAFFARRSFSSFHILYISTVMKVMYFKNLYIILVHLAMVLIKCYKLAI